MKKFFSSILILILISSPALSNSQFSLDGTVFEKVGNNHSIDPLLLYSIAITESATGAGDGMIGPYPYVFRTKEGAQFFKTKEDAEIALKKVIEVTKHVDIGMMQINLHYHPQEEPLELLDPEKNLVYAASYLKKTIASTDDPILGVGRYHTYTKELATWYGTAVWTTYKNLLEISGTEQF